MKSWKPRAIQESEVDEFRTRVSQGFGSDMSEEDGARDRFLEIFDLERTFAVFDDDELIGTGGAFTFDLTVPGGFVPMGGTTIITVRATHRRQGVLNAMMDYHLDEVASRGEPVSGLWASEGSIYGRFGYGIASMSQRIDVAADKITFRPSDAKLRVGLVDETDARPIIEEIYEAVSHEYPGMFNRTTEWWDARTLGPDKPSDGFSKRRYGVAYRDRTPEGYVSYRQKLDWSDGTPKGEVQVIELMSTHPDARRSLWEFLTNIDLFRKVTWWNTPVDEPLRAMTYDPRQVAGDTPSDALWIRLLNLPAALEGRSYESDDVLSIAVSDDFRPHNDGTYRLAVSEGIGSCSLVDGPADVTCGVDVLGHLYLGGGDAIAMAAAGRVVGELSDVHRLHRLFRTSKAPWCPEIF